MSILDLGIVGHTVSGTPIRKVRCSLCGETYRRVGFPSDIRRLRGCAACALKNRTVLANNDTEWEETCP